MAPQTITKMRKLLLIAIIVCKSYPISAQNYETLFSTQFSIARFKNIELDGQRDHIYFQPTGLSGAPCSVLDSMNLNTYRLFHSGELFQPYNLMLQRFVCDDINGGCEPVAIQFFDISSEDTNFAIGLRTIEGGPSYINCQGINVTKYTTYNGGSTIHTSPSAYKTNSIDIAETNDSLILISTDAPWPYSLFRSTDRGATFNNVAVLQTYLTGFVKFSEHNPRFVFLSTSNGLYRSVTYGASFTRLTGIPSFSDIEFDNDNSLYGINFTGIFRSTNSGVNWNQIFTGLCTAIKVDPNNDSILYVGTTNGVYRSTNKGVSFYRQGFNFPITNYILGISKDENSGDTLVVCTMKGIYKVWDLNTSLTPVTHTIPADYELKQNYPNPFNPSTNIQFDLPEISNVLLSVYDISGRIIAELVSTTLIAGSYTYSWDGSKFSSGLYFTRLTALGQSGKSYIHSTKMIMTK